MEKYRHKSAPMGAKTKRVLRVTGKCVPKGANLAPARAPNLKAFEPITGAAMDQIRFLLQRGATLVAVTRDLVTLHRFAQVATVDKAGRVEWAPLAA